LELRGALKDDFVAFPEDNKEKASCVFLVGFVDGVGVEPPRVFGTAGLDGAEELQRSEKASDIMKEQQEPELRLQPSSSLSMICLGAAANNAEWHAYLIRCRSKTPPL
jgi:hypothetical protein